MQISASQFEKLVDEGLELIPGEIRRFMENVQIVIEDHPSDDLLDDLGVPEDETIYGLYEGTPLTERTSDYCAFPDRIIIYRRPLLEDFDAPEELRREVARTVVHEVGHHFGIDEERLAELGWD
ncbi:MAG: metallopeptidase family protein [Verrucomicrobia bacterium]|nr:metallopeptidase family protein [Verrucomicrobiota bacterium]